MVAREPDIENEDRHQGVTPSCDTILTVPAIIGMDANLIEPGRPLLLSSVNATGDASEDAQIVAMRSPAHSNSFGTINNEMEAIQQSQPRAQMQTAMRPIAKPRVDDDLTPDDDGDLESVKADQDMATCRERIRPSKQRKVVEIDSDEAYDEEDLELKLLKVQLKMKLNRVRSLKRREDAGVKLE